MRIRVGSELRSLPPGAADQFGGQFPRPGVVGRVAEYMPQLGCGISRVALLGQQFGELEPPGGTVGGKGQGVTVRRDRFLAVGGPEKVANLIGEWAHEMGTSHINIYGHLGNVPNWKSVKSITLFAEEVMPRLRRRGITEVREAAE